MINAGDEYMADMPIIDHDKCQQCGLCASICACGALVADENGSFSFTVGEKGGGWTFCVRLWP